MSDEDKKLPVTSNQMPLANNDHKASEKIEMQRATAMVFAAFQCARQFPRDEKERTDRILHLCKNVGFASEALYKVPRAGGAVEGLSIKAAREFARVWGNCEGGYINHGRYGAETQMEAFAMDLETNYRFTTRYTVDHRRSAKHAPETSPQGISEIEKANSSKEVRNCLLGIIPYFILEEAETTCKRTIASTVKDIPEAFQQSVKFFASKGISEASIWRFINRKPELQGDKYAKVTAKDIVDLRILGRTAKEEPANFYAFFPERDKTKDVLVENNAATELPSPAAPTQSEPIPAESVEVLPPSVEAPIEAEPVSEAELTPVETVQEQPKQTEVATELPKSRKERAKTAADTATTNSAAKETKQEAPVDALPALPDKTSEVDFF